MSRHQLPANFDARKVPMYPRGGHRHECRVARKSAPGSQERRNEELWKGIEQRILLGDDEVDARYNDLVESTRKWALKEGMEGSLVEYITDLCREKWRNRGYIIDMVNIGEEALKKYGMEVVPEKYRLKGGNGGAGNDGDGGDGGEHW